MPLLTILLAFPLTLVLCRHRPTESTPTMRSAPKAVAAVADRARRWALQAALHTPLLMSTARTAGTLSLAVRAAQQHGAARRPAPSAIAALIFILLPSANGYHSHLALWLAAADMLVLFACAAVVGFMGRRGHGAVGLGDLVAAGGAGGCPR